MIVIPAYGLQVLIIVAANAGGAWSPIGDVTTTMLWIGDKVTTLKLISYVLVPSIVCLIIPVGIASFLPAFQGEYKNQKRIANIKLTNEGLPCYILGLSAIVFVPVFKTLTHLTPLCRDDVIIGNCINICRDF